MSDKPTGIAQINVDKAGENNIVIIPGANDDLLMPDIDNANELFQKSKVLVCQLETSLPVMLHALKNFKHGVSILNPSPAPEEITIGLFTLPSILCVNQTEAAVLTKREVPNIE